MKTITQKWFISLAIVILLNITLAPSINAEITPMVDNDPCGIPTNCTLSGYVNDTDMNPIAGALVRVSFHGTYEENYTNTAGYYHVTNIPLCNCTKNCTASKPGYKTTSVQLSIDLNTWYDFVLLSDTILYVGGTGPGNYTRIQDAINNATTGDTIFVYDGTYPEHLIINKSLLLQGQDQYTTIIDGNYTNTTVTINADYTTLSGFTITHGGPTRYTAGIHINANHTSIHHNQIIQNIQTGIRIPRHTNDGITHTTITHNYIAQSHIGIYLQLVAHTTISYNLFDNNFCAINTQIGFLVNGCENTTIHHNTLSNNECSIDLNGGWKTTIHHNNFNNNTRNAKFYLENDAIWDHNYWDRPRILPKIILGRALIFIIMYPALNVDWHPALQPYDVCVNETAPDMAYGNFSGEIIVVNVGNSSDAGVVAASMTTGALEGYTVSERLIGIIGELVVDENVTSFRMVLGCGIRILEYDNGGLVAFVVPYVMTRVLWAGNFTFTGMLKPHFVKGCIWYRVD